MDDFDHNDFFIKIEEMDMDSLAAHARIKMNHFKAKNDSLMEQHLEKELKRIQKKLKKIQSKKN